MVRFVEWVVNKLTMYELMISFKTLSLKGGEILSNPEKFLFW